MSGRNRILFITPLPPPIHGSAVVSDCIRRSEVIGGRFECDFVNLSTSRSNSEVGRRGLLKIGRFIASYFRTLRLLVSQRYGFCYIALTCYGKGFLKDAPFALLCKTFGRRLVIHQHNKGMASYADKPLYRTLYKWVYSGSKVILLSWNLYSDIESVVSREQVLVCPNGIEDAPLPERQTNEAPVVLFMSNLMESKGPLVLLDACRLLLDGGLHFRCKIAGDETFEISRSRMLSEIESRGLSDVVSYLGPCYGAEKEALLSSADIFVHPTSNDCFPLVLLEALRSGIPVVSTREGGIPDMVRDGVDGLLCCSASADELAAAVGRLCSDAGLREEMGKAGRESFESRFELGAFERRLADILEECTNG